MFNLFLLWFGALRHLFRSRRNLVLENLVLRQQLVVLKRRHPRLRLGALDKLFWIAARRCWSGWKHALIVVTPETVVRWHRAGFRFYWRLISRVRKQVGRRQTSKEARVSISQMVAENPTWGAPRIHGELLMLGFDVSERTISRWSDCVAPASANAREKKLCQRGGASGRWRETGLKHPERIARLSSPAFAFSKGCCPVNTS